MNARDVLHAPRPRFPQACLDADVDTDFADMFEEPRDFRPPTPCPTDHIFERRLHASQDKSVTIPVTPARINYTLIGQHSLWAHVAWNAGLLVAHWFDAEPELVRGKRVLELGAGAALPSMIAALQGAAYVVATDYPDAEIVQNLEHNIARNCGGGNIVARGFAWGADPQSLLALPETSSTVASGRFDVILLCDLVFNHSQHENMLRSCTDCLAQNEDALVLCAFTHHRPWLAHKDRAILDMARAAPFCFDVELVRTERMDVMFEADPGDEEVRGTVHVYRFRRGNGLGGGDWCTNELGQESVGAGQSEVCGN